jgi:hypothetical protein
MGAMGWNPARRLPLRERLLILLFSAITGPVRYQISGNAICKVQNVN